MRSVPKDVIADGLITDYEIDEDEAHSLAKMSMGAPGWAIATLSDPSMLDARNQSAARIIGLFSADLVERFDYASQMARQFRNDRDHRHGRCGEMVGSYPVTSQCCRTVCGNT